MKPSKAKEQVKVYIQENSSKLTTILVTAILCIIISIAGTMYFTPDPTKDLLKKHKQERKVLQHEIDSIRARGDAIFELYTKVKHKNDSLINRSIAASKKRRAAIKKKKNEEINNLNATNGEYLNVLSAERSN